MAKNWLTDEQVEREIESLRNSEYVKLAKKETQNYPSKEMRN